MKNLLLRPSALLVLSLGLFMGPVVADAMTPTLTVSASGSSNSVAITVYSDPYASVVMYYQVYNSGLQSQYLGTTNSGGYLSTTVGSTTYNINAGSMVYVVVNNQTSSSVAWPYAYNYNYNYNNYNYGNGYGGTLTLSQTSASVGVGQSIYVTVSGGNQPYTMYPSGANVFQAVISGNNLQVSGLANGTGSINVCSAGGTGSGCAVLYVTVNPVNYYGGYNNYNYNNNYSGNQISLSPSSLSLNSGGTGTVSIYGTGSYYYVSTNSNPSVASAYINGNTINVSAVNYGTDTISICQSNGQCASLYVTVNYGSTGYNNSPIQAPVAFSQTNPTLAVGQTMTISVSGGNTSNYYGGTYNIAYNSNPTGLSATLNGNSLTIQGLASSNNAVTVCSSSTNCTALNVVVGPVGYASSGSGNWISCAGENQFCSFSGTRTVQYGANGVYAYRTLTNGVTCSNGVFGDPLPGVAKRCSYSGSY